MDGLILKRASHLWVHWYFTFDPCCPVCGSCNARDWTNHQWSSVESVHNLRGIMSSIFLISETGVIIYIIYIICNGCINEKKTQFDVIYGLLSSIPCFGNSKTMDTSITSRHGVPWGCSPIQLQVYLGFQSCSKTVVTSDSMYHPQDMLGSPGVRHFIAQTWMNGPSLEENSWFVFLRWKQWLHGFCHIDPRISHLENWWGHNRWICHTWVYIYIYIFYLFYVYLFT